MDNAPRGGFISFTFVVGFGLGIFIGAILGAVFVALPEDETPGVVEVQVFVTGTPNPRDDDAPEVRTTASLQVRVGPGESFATLGTVGRGDEVDVIGRDFESKWLAIRFPRGSTSRGWIPADGVEGLESSSVTTLAVLLPTPLPFVFNTPSPFSGFGSGGTNGGGGASGPSGTPTPVPTTSDLVVQSVRVLNDGRISVTVSNRGPAHIVDQIVQVQIRPLGGGGETFSHVGTFPSGESITFRTNNLRLTVPTDIQAIVDPGANINDPVRSNNVVTQALIPEPTSVPAPSATPPPFG